MTQLTQNFADLKTQVEQHVKADDIIQGKYWTGSKGCFIGCLSHSDNPLDAIKTFGLTLPLLRIAENIFEALPIDDAKSFFASLPDAIGCDGKDLSKVHWQFLAAELRSLPPQPKEIQDVISPVIAGMDLLASGQEWPYAAADAAAYAAYAADADDADADDADDAARAAAYAARAAAYAADADDAARAADAAAYAAYAADADDAARAAYAAYAAAAYAARLRQRDTLLRLITEAPMGAPSHE
jgi:hypothetical protein